MTRLAGVFLFITAIVAPGPGDRARPAAQTNNDQSDVWEVTVSARSHQHVHAFSSTGGPAVLREQKLFDGDDTFSIFFIERLHGTFDDGNLDVGDDPDAIVAPATGSGSASEVSHARDTVGTGDLEERWDTKQGVLDTAPGSAGMHFAWDASSRQGMFEAGAHYTGTYNFRHHIIHVPDRKNQTTNETEKYLQGQDFGGTAKHPVTVTRTKYGFAVDWSWSETTRDPNGGTKEVDQSGHASIRRYIKHEPMELVVSPADYQTWLPQAGADQKTPGNMLAVQAALRTQSGKPIPDDQKALKIRFELLDVSREPGICMNYPDALTTVIDDADPDLQFAAAGSMTLSPADHPNSAETPDGEDGLTDASALIASYDWGAWASLRVTAQLEDGEMIVGHLESDPHTTEILLPRRKSRGQQVAAFWKEQRGITSPDDDDSETLKEPPNTGTPEGHLAGSVDHSPGDGYTLYEEYRGFMEAGAHIYGDPTKKDLMVWDEINGRSKDGIRLFQDITGILVHDRITEAEFGDDRVMNFNHSVGAHDVDQHGLILVGSTEGGPAHADGVPGGTPGQHTLVVISADFSPGPDGWNTIRAGRSKIVADDYAATIAHELLHACAVLHHGDSDPPLVLWSKGVDAAGRPAVIESAAYDDNHGILSPLPGGHPIVVRRENGSAVSPDDFANPELIQIGADGGQHSGFANCVMRYNTAEAYKSATDPSVRYYVDEGTGVSLCDTKSDLPGGENAAGHKPQPRYGDASRGDCFHQIKLKDGQ